MDWNIYVGLNTIEALAVYIIYGVKQTFKHRAQI